MGEIESIYRAAPIGLSYISSELKFIRINEQLAQINGLAVAEHIGLTIRDVLPELADAVEPLYRQVIESGKPILHLEVSGTTPSQPGVERHWLASYYPQTEIGDRVVGVNAIVPEITDRKRSEAARLSAEQERDRFFDRSIDLLALGNFEGYFVRINPAFERLLGFTEAEFVSRLFIDFVHPEPVGVAMFDRDIRYIVASDVWLDCHELRDSRNERVRQRDIVGRSHYDLYPNLPQQWKEMHQRCLAGAIESCEEDLFPRPDGSIDWVRWEIRPWYTDTDEVGGIVMFSETITDRQQAQADLEERNRELDSFVYVVSHDLKAPLRAVSNLSQWIEDDLEGQLTADTRSQMNLLRSRVDRMAATIDGLLEYARVGRSEDEIEPIAVARLLADVMDSVAPPPTFTIDLPTELPTFSTKRIPLFQVFVNLIGNGIKHHHSEAGKIQISIAEHGDWYEFAIADDGSGIAPEHQERMFKIFQAVNPQKRSDSTGIGLAITSGRLRQRQKNHRSRRWHHLAGVRAW